MFEIEQEIKKWKGRLRSIPAFEAGEITELESHLREELIKLKTEGYSDEEAFLSATQAIGDLEKIGVELYKVKVGTSGKKPTWQRPLWIQSFLPGYWKVAIRNFKKDTVYTFINVLGLALGLASCSLIGLYIQYHLSYDTHYKDSQNIFRLSLSKTSDIDNSIRDLAFVPGHWGPGLIEEFPQANAYARFFRYREDIIIHNIEDDMEFYERNFYWTDHSVFDVFGLNVLNGEPGSALLRPNTVVISKSMAEKYFKDKNPLGQIINHINGDSEVSLEVTGVFDDMPAQSHFYPEFMASISTIADEWWIQDYDRMDSWEVPFWITYLKLDHEISNSELNKFLKAKIGTNSSYYEAKLQPIGTIHLNSNLVGEFEENGTVEYLYGLGTVGVFILLIACINYMNLSTAKATRRIKEVSVRKIMGSSRRQLIVQFLGESMMFCGVALLIGILTAEFVRPYLNEFTGDWISSDYLTSMWFWLFIASIIFIVGVGAGSYPAIYLSAFRQLEVFKKKPGYSLKGKRFREILVIGQFSISVFLLIATLVIFIQLDYINTKTLGFDDKLQITIPLRGQGLQSNSNVLKEKLRASPQILDLSYSSNILMKGWHRGPLNLPDIGHSDNTYNWDFLHVDHDFGKSMGVELVAGRYPIRQLASDSSAAILNESAVSELGLTIDEVIGKRIRNNWGVDGRVVGVAKDFHYGSLHENIRPFALLVNYDFGVRYINIKVSSENLQETIRHIKQTWNEISPNTPFSYQFLDDRIDQLYRREQSQSMLMTYFTALAILISCLGLLGLVSFMTVRRMQEIGIRKVLGASVLNIVKLLSFDFLKQVIIGFLIGAPLAWLAMNYWLQTFAYRIQIGLGVVLLSGASIILLAMLTVSYHSSRSALMNPVNSIRDE